MKILKIVSLGFFLLFSISCEKEKAQKKSDFEIVNQTDAKFDIVFTQELWDEILRKAPLTVDTKKNTYELFESLSTQVEVVDGPKEVLNGKNYRFDFKDFGGEINWNNYLNREAVGNFKIYFNFPALSEESDMRVYYMSWSKQSSKDDEVFGNGCGYFYDVTGYFKKEVFKKGLLLHTSNYRYLDLAAGRFYFVNYTKEKIQLAQVTLTDSSLDNRLCADRL
ncbi:MAG: hypothetical protein V4596_02620 [Bdellovibrionota bacterium]